MSEPLQLIGKIYVGKEELAKFRSRNISSTERYNDWGQWLANKKWHGGGSYQVIFRQAIVGISFEEWFGQFFKSDQFGNWFAPVFDKYDEKERCWTFLVFGFSENYIDFVSAVNALRQIDSIGNASIKGVFSIVPYAFGKGFSNVEVVVSIENGKSKISSSATSEFQSWANKAMKDAADAQKD